MDCCESSGLSASDLVSVFLAFAAFVVSVASLWFTSLRRPRVEVETIDRAYPLAMSGWAGAMPYDEYVQLWVFVVNSGASGTVMESLDLIDFRERNAGTPLWADFDARPTAPTGFSLPLPLERDDAKSGHITRYVRGTARNVEEYAQRLATLQEISFTVAWKYRRPNLLRPRTRESVPAGREFTFDAVLSRHGGSGRRGLTPMWISRQSKRRCSAMTSATKARVSG